MELEALYQAEILELAKRGRKLKPLSDKTHSARVDNPICGDRITVELRLKDGVVEEMGAKVQGCALCQASAALIADVVTGNSPERLKSGTVEITGFLKSGDELQSWGRLSAFAPVKEAKSRHECVLLPFWAAEKALEEGS